MPFLARLKGTLEFQLSALLIRVEGIHVTLKSSSARNWGLKKSPKLRMLIKCVRKVVSIMLNILAFCVPRVHLVQQVSQVPQEREAHGWVDGFHFPHAVGINNFPVRFFLVLYSMYFLWKPAWIFKLSRTFANWRDA